MIVLSTGSLHTYGTARVFELAVQVGFDGIEILVDHRWDTRDPAYLRRLSQEYSLPIMALHSPFVLDVAGWPDDQHGRLERTVALAQELSVPVVVTHLPFRSHAVIVQWLGQHARRLAVPIPWPRWEPYDDLLQDSQRLSALEQSSSVVVAVENMPCRRLFGIPVPIYRMNTPQGWAHLQHMTLDTTHIGTWDLDILHIYEQVKEQIVHVHLSNYDGKEHRSPPNGRLPLDALLGLLARDGFRGAVSIESSPDALDAEDEGRCRSALAQALAFCRRHLSASEPPQGG